MITEEKNIAYNHANVQVFHLLEDLEAAGQTSSPRGLITKEANLATLDFDPIYTILDYSPKKFNWKYFAGELAWYIQADTKIDFINKFSSFWKTICLDGTANSNYGNILFKYHPSTINTGNKVNQLEWIYNSLIKDKNTRQAVAFFNSPYFQQDGNKDFVCTMYINFWIRKDYLDMKVQMRSNDIFFGLSYDAPWFSTLMQSMYLNLKEIYPELKLGVYYHCADNIHFYERHFDLANEILDSQLDSSISLKLKYPLFRFEPGNEIGNQKLIMHEKAINFSSMVKDIVEDGNNHDQEHWKSMLGYLYDIS